MSALKYILAPVLMGTLAFPSQARWFEVEVLLFARNQDPTELSEEFSQSRFTPMRVRKQDLLSSVLLSPSDCPEPAEPQGATEEALYDEFGFPIAHSAQAEAPFIEAESSMDAAAQLPATGEATDALEQEILLDEFGFPMELKGEPVRTLEEKAAYEQWLVDCQKPKQLNEYDLLPVTAATMLLPESDQAPYVLPREQLQLTDALSQLASNPNYQPMLHTGWRMDIQKKRQMRAIRLVAGQNFGQEFNQDGWEHLEELEVDEVTSAEQALTEQGSPLDEQAITAQEPLQPTSLDENLQLVLEELPRSDDQSELEKEFSLHELFGEQSEAEQEPRQDAVWEMQTDLRIWLASWLHMETQTTLRRLGQKVPPAIDASAGEIAEVTSAELEPSGSLVAEADSVPYLYSYHMDQFRRVRSEEIHYFDHPLMGVIVQIRPYTPRELTEEHESDDEQLSQG